jgi:hypothetical protein
MDESLVLKQDQVATFIIVSNTYRKNNSTRSQAGTPSIDWHDGCSNGIENGVFCRMAFVDTEIVRTLVKAKADVHSSNAALQVVVLAQDRKGDSFMVPGEEGEIVTEESKGFDNHTV